MRWNASTTPTTFVVWMYLSTKIAVMHRIILLAVAFSATSLMAQSYYKQLVKSVEVPVTVEQAFTMWTTVEGVQSFLCEQANIGGKPGEAYEIFFSMDYPEGSRGNEGGTITQYWDNQKLGFTWNAPPTFEALRKAGDRTEVFVVFSPEEGQMTKVTLGQIGWKEGSDWDELYTYFDKAWTAVLQAYEEAAWKKAMEPFAFLEGRWQQQDDATRFLQCTFDKKLAEASLYTLLSDGNQQINESFQILLDLNGWNFVPFLLTQDGDKVGIAQFLLVKQGDGLVQFYNGTVPFPEDVFFTKDSDNTITYRQVGNVNGLAQEVVRTYQRVE